MLTHIPSRVSRGADGFLSFGTATINFYAKRFLRTASFQFIHHLLLDLVSHVLDLAQVTVHLEVLTKFLLDIGIL